MANEIKAKQSAAAAMTCTLASLASSSTGVGRQTTIIDNSTNLYQLIHVYAKITTGTSPTADKSIWMYLLKGDGHATAFRTDGAGASDAGITIVSARLLAAAHTSSTSDQAYYLHGVIYNPGPEWGVAIVHDTGVNLNSTAGNHFIHYVGENPEVQ